MVEGLNITNQFTLVNAPAGSGKTTTLSKSIKKLVRTPNKKILCITYTNRAANQLIEKVENERVEISTIHSFISNFMSTFFKLKPIIEFFIGFYEQEILDLLKSEDEKQVIKLNRYREKHNLDDEYKITVQTIIENINSVTYGETQFTSFLYGRLSHDDLLIFSKAACEQFPKIKKAISQRYSYIFIDEYQDTQTEILELFYSACVDSDTKLVFLGDEMQQIYPDRVDGFKTILNECFERDYSLKNNWRSQADIVKLLNNLYLDASYQQIPKIIEEGKPKIFITNNFNHEIKLDILQLVLYNSDLFSAINAINLYNAYNERYKYYDNLSSKEILLDMTMENPDDLIVLLIFITDIINHFNNNQFGKLIQKIMNYKFSNKEIWKINSHSDKVKVVQQLNQLRDETNKDITLEELLDFMRENEIVYTSHIDMVISKINEELEFKNMICSVKYIEFLNCYNETKNPKFSTQHAVKGEGHDHVALMISDGRIPNVKMYFFLEMFSKNLFNFEELFHMHNEIKHFIKSFSASVRKKVSALKVADYNQNEQEFRSCFMNVKGSLMKNEKFFEVFFADEFSKYEGKPNFTNFSKCIKSTNKIEGALLAYKLFYVGCSRAKKQLSVYVTSERISSFKEEFISKMECINFEVEIEAM